MHRYGNDDQSTEIQVSEQMDSPGLEILKNMKNCVWQVFAKKDCKVIVTTSLRADGRY